MSGENLTEEIRLAEAGLKKATATKACTTTTKEYELVKEYPGSGMKGTKVTGLSGKKLFETYPEFYKEVVVYAETWKAGDYLRYASDTYLINKVTKDYIYCNDKPFCNYELLANGTYKNSIKKATAAEIEAYNKKLQKEVAFGNLIFTFNADKTTARCQYGNINKSDVAEVIQLASPNLSFFGYSVRLLVPKSDEYHKVPFIKLGCCEASWDELMTLYCTFK